MIQTTNDSHGYNLLYPSQKKFKIQNHHLALQQPMTSSHAIELDSQMEVMSMKYRHPTSAEEDDLLRFWQENHFHFPKTAVVTRKYLGLSASSVPVECIHVLYSWTDSEWEKVVPFTTQPKLFKLYS